jgi:hypothetical protein
LLRYFETREQILLVLAGQPRLADVLSGIISGYLTKGAATL